MDYKQYKRKQIAELADWNPEMDMAGVSISEADTQNGSPKVGDKIARNPKNHNDRWLVAEKYFIDNFEALYQPEKRDVCMETRCGTCPYIDVKASQPVSSDLLTDSEIRRLPEPLRDDSMESYEAVAKAQLAKVQTSGQAIRAEYEAKIKELEDKLKFCDYDDRIKLGETWYWMGDGEDHLEGLTCPVIINANELRHLLIDSKAEVCKEIGEWTESLYEKIDASSDNQDFIMYLGKAIAKLKSGQMPKWK